jgi:hypothetical protein
MSEHEAAWFALHDALLPNWSLGPATYDAFTRLWSVTARSPRPHGRQPKSKYHVTGMGPTEDDAARDLTAKLLAGEAGTSRR